MLLAEPLTEAQRRYVLLDNCVFPFIINFGLNGAIAWLVFRNASRVLLWGQNSIAGDTIVTCFLLPLITCLIVTPLARSQLRAGRMAPVRGRAPLNWFPRNSFLRGTLIGVLLLVVLIPITLMGLNLAGVASLSRNHFLLFKAGFAASEGALVTPFLALMAMSKDEGMPEIGSPR